MKLPTPAMIALAAVLATAWAVAQPPETPPAPPDGKGTRHQGMHMGKDGNPAKAREMLEQVMIARLSSELKLNDEQSVVLMRRFTEAREAKQALSKERGEAMRELRAIVEQQKDEKALNECLTRLHDLDAKLASHKQQLQETMGADLNPWQKARLALFLEQFEADLRQMLREAREHRNGPAMGPMGPMPGMPPGPGMMQPGMQPGMPGMQPGMQPGMPGMGPHGFGRNPMQPGPNGPAGMQPPQWPAQGPPQGPQQGQPQGPPPNPPQMPPPPPAQAPAR